jgi:glutamate racemase
MLKIVVLDSGYGGELFADKLKEQLNIVEVIRVIDWRNAEKYLYKKREARLAAEEALRPYLGKVDLIVIANYYLTITSLKYFCRKYTKQKFVGINFTMPSTFIDRNTLVLTTSAVAKTLSYHNYLFSLRRRNIVTMTLDDWPGKIDDGELTRDEIEETLMDLIITRKFFPREIIIACSQFNDIVPDLRSIFKNQIRIHESFPDLYNDTCRVLRIRGGVLKQK